MTPWFRRLFPGRTVTKLLAGVDVKTYFHAELDCGCVFTRMKGVDPCRQHARDVFFQTTYARIMLDLAGKLDDVDGLQAKPGMQGDVTP